MFRDLFAGVGTQYDVDEETRQQMAAQQMRQVGLSMLAGAFGRNINPAAFLQQGFQGMEHGLRGHQDEQMRRLQMQQRQDSDAEKRRRYDEQLRVAAEKEQYSRGRDKVRDVVDHTRHKAKQFKASKEEQESLAAYRTLAGSMGIEVPEASTVETIEQQIREHQAKANDTRIGNRQQADDDRYMTNQRELEQMRLARPVASNDTSAKEQRELYGIAARLESDWKKENPGMQPPSFADFVKAARARLGAVGASSASPDRLSELNAILGGN